MEKIVADPHNILKTTTPILDRLPVSDSSSHAVEPQRELRDRFRAGVPGAMDELAEKFFDDVYRFSLALLSDPDMAMDAVQETFLRLLERHELYDSSRAFRPWLFTICRNCCLGLIRRRSTQSAKLILMEPTGEEIQRLASEVPPVFERMIREEREGEALAALETVPEDVRTIIVLHLFEELTFREIGEMLRRPPATVATTYYRTMTKLKDRMIGQAADARVLEVQRVG